MSSDTSSGSIARRRGMTVSGCDSDIRGAADVVKAGARVVQGHDPSHVRDARGNKRRNRIPAISRWQILDNLRRSLRAPSIVLLLVAGWTILPGAAWWWGVFALLTLAFPVYAHVTTGLLIHPRGIPWTSHFWSVWGDLRTNTSQIAIEIVFLAHQALLMTDAIARTIYRQLISHRHLLEWLTAASSERTSKHDLAAFIRFMWPAEVIVVIATALIVAINPAALPVMRPPQVGAVIVRVYTA